MTEEINRARLVAAQLDACMKVGAELEYRRRIAIELLEAMTREVEIAEHLLWRMRETLEKLRKPL